MNGSLRKRLQESLGISESQLNRLIKRAPYTYKVYSIPKRSGGVRVIAQPAKETKFIQHWLIKNIFQKLPIHECSMAYKEGSSIKKNATAHQNNSYITKFDFENFFTSIRADDLVMHISKHLEGSFCTEDIKDIARIACIKHKVGDGLCLSIGAPSSPVLSNTIMFEFDREVSAWCLKHCITYTRYADDLTFSTNTKGISSKIEPAIREIVQKLEYPRLEFNAKKTTHLSRKHQRRITGLIINNDGNISLGRDRKREISTLIHKCSLRLLSETEIYNLQGLLGFAKDIEPLFLNRMRTKYSSELIDEILQKRKQKLPT
ncbi:retron St85 family RNA-directed DNA polymerase [Methylobacter sp. Wu8]|uniref:retron St85 family RNA-directed DNA polymerase n=1 Tax=Methylobacter sp. Wu8 TaxID=3118457 RepID=UPI002F2C9AC2